MKNSLKKMQFKSRKLKKEILGHKQHEQKIQMIIKTAAEE